MSNQSILKESSELFSDEAAARVASATSDSLECKTPDAGSGARRNDRGMAHPNGYGWSELRKEVVMGHVMPHGVAELTTLYSSCN